MDLKFYIKKEEDKWTPWWWRISRAFSSTSPNLLTRITFINQSVRTKTQIQWEYNLMFFFFPFYELWNTNVLFKLDDFINSKRTKGVFILFSSGVATGEKNKVSWIQSTPHSHKNKLDAETSIFHVNYWFWSSFKAHANILNNGTI